MNIDVCPYNNELCGGMGLCKKCRQDAAGTASVHQ